MKKRLTAILAAAAVMSPMCSFAAELPESVEIDFAVGDSVLMVNGEQLEVTAPYIVGDGTTLVPVRVITEAFGAEVGWDGDTKTVTLEYPGVSITLQIGSLAAQVNDHTEQLAAAPELYNDTTMVPLRFISETFDAEVGWDAETSRVTVTKKASSEQTQLETGTDKAYVGDSYYGWSIKNPTIMEMEERSFDGRETVFMSESGFISITIEDMYDELTADDVYDQMADFVSDMTVSAADRTTDANGNEVFHFRAKDTEETYDLLAVIKDDRIYSAHAMALNDAADLNDIMDIAGSFSLTVPEDMYDMTNIEDGKRTFTDDAMQVSLKLPADFYQQELGSTNEFRFVSEKNSAYGVSLSIYSKTDTVTAAALAEEDRARNASRLNPELVTVSDMTNVSAAGADALQYTVNVNGAGKKGSFVLKDTFFELGGYVYDIACQTETAEAADEILASLAAEQLDAEKTGVILKDIGTGGTTDFKLGTKTVTLPEGWSSIVAASGSNVGMFMSDNGSASVLAMELEGAAPSDMRSLVEEMGSKDQIESSYEGAGTVVSILPGSIETVQLGGMTVYKKTACVELEDYTEYETYYGVAVSNKGYFFAYSRRDVEYGGALDTEAESIIASIE